MSQQLTMLQVLNQHLNAGDNPCWFFDCRNDSALRVNLTRLQCAKKSIYGLLVISCLSAGQVRAQPPEIFSGYFGHVPFASQTVIAKGIEFNKKVVSDSVELLSFVPVLGEPMSKPDPQAKSTYRPDERNEGRIGVEQKNKLTPDDTHRFWRLLLIQLSVFAVVFPVGVYISMRANLRREWRKHIPKGGRLKVPTLGMISILCISRCIKPRGWRIWEQRHWFRDMQACHGIEVAYRDTRCWKKIIAEKW